LLVYEPVLLPLTPYCNNLVRLRCAIVRALVSGSDAFGASPTREGAKPISTQKAKIGLFHLHLEASRHEDWFRDEGDFQALFEKTIAIAEGTETRWLVIPDPERGGQYAAALGLFFHNGICRLQEVMTASAFRSRGLATRLLGQAASCAMEAGIEVVALLADPQSRAHRLYERLGFSDLSSDVTLMRY
jgi:GNAT superfamily N-acetyltransferase